MARKQNPPSRTEARGATVDRPSPTPGPFRPQRIAILLIVVLGPLFFVDVLASRSDQLLAGPDFQHYFFRIYQHARAQLLSGELPLWTPHIYCGMPFAANPQCSVFYPPSWLYLVMPVISAMKWLIVLHVVLAGLFMFLFLRSLGLGTMSALAGCLPWMFGSYARANADVGHLTMLYTMAWLPAVFFCYERFWLQRRPVWLFWTGFVLGVQVLAGEAQNCYYSALAVAIYGVGRALFDAPSVPDANAGATAPSHVRRGANLAWWLGGLVVVGLTAALTAGIQLAPTLEFARESDRQTNTFEFATYSSFHPGSALGFIVPWTFRVRALRFEAWGGMVPLHWELACHLGLAPLVLALRSCGVRGDARVAALRGLAVAGFLLALGRYTPLYAWLFDWLPGLKLFRVPGRALLLFVFAACALTAFGAQHLLNADARRRQRDRWRWPIAAVGLGLLVLLAIGPRLTPIVALSQELGGRMRETEFALHGFDPLIRQSIFALAGMVVMFVVIGRLSRRTAGVVLLLATGADLFLSRPRPRFLDYSESVDAGLRLLEQFRRENPAERLYRTDLPMALLSANTSLVGGVSNVNGYWPLALRRYYSLVHTMRNKRPSPVKRQELLDDFYHGPNPFPYRMLNVRYAAKYDPGTRSFSIARDPDFAPRAWLVDRIEVTADDDAAIARMRQPDFDPLRVVVLERPLAAAPIPRPAPLPACGIAADAAGNLRITVDAPRDAVLVLSEVFYPGWRAYVDGQPAELRRANVALSAVAVPAGKHEIQYRYEPSSLRFGAAGTLAAGAAAVALAWRSRAQRRASMAGAKPTGG